MQILPPYGINEIIMSHPEGTPDILDSISAEAAEIGALQSAIPLQTTIGSTVLAQMMRTGLPGKGAIERQQEAVQELLDDNNAELRNQLLADVRTFSRFSGGMAKFIDGGAGSRTVFEGAASGSRVLEGLGQRAQTDNGYRLKSDYNVEALQAINQFNGTEAAGLLRGPIYFTRSGLQTREQSTRGLRHRFYPITGPTTSIGGTVAGIGAITNLLPPEFIAAAAPAYGTMFDISWAGFTHGQSFKDALWNQHIVYKPLRNRLANTPYYPRAMEAIGRLDVILGLGELATKFQDNGHDVVFPDVHDSETFHFSATDLKNPLLALEAGRKIVGNTIELGGEGEHLTFLTGPNSGGKSTLSKALVQSQILAQIGGPVVASRAETGVTDGITYHVPMPPDQKDESGRFGFELQRVRGIIDSASPRSLTILDDCLDGTTHQERIAILKNVMAALLHKGGTTLFSTHAHELVEDFEANGIGQFVQVEFGDNEPTYRVKPGISQSSHAEAVARKHKLTREQVASEIAQANGSVPEWF